MSADNPGLLLLTEISLISMGIKPWISKYMYIHVKSGMSLPIHALTPMAITSHTKLWM